MISLVYLILALDSISALANPTSKNTHNMVRKFGVVSMFTFKLNLHLNLHYVFTSAIPGTE